MTGFYTWRVGGFARSIYLDGSKTFAMAELESPLYTQAIKDYSAKNFTYGQIDDAFANGITPSDYDQDTIMNYLDLDSDNDGIYDLKESGSNVPDINLDGIIDGNNFGSNGLANSVETAPESGKLNYTITDTDADGIPNYGIFRA